MDISTIGSEITKAFSASFANISVTRILFVLFWLITLSVLIKVIQIIALRLTKKRTSDQTRMLLKKAIAYIGFVIIVIVFVKTLGFDISAILGAAGIAGIAIGFAAQTSISNVISGLFLISEKPFAVGDVISTADVTGIVLSIDVLSVKIKTFDNTFVRVPNELIIKSKVVNVTKYPIRRLDISVFVACQNQLGRILEILSEIVAANLYCLRNPGPLIMVKEFTETGVEIMVGAWYEKSVAVEVKNTLMVQIQDRFGAEGIVGPIRAIHIDQ